MFLFIHFSFLVVERLYFVLIHSIFLRFNSFSEFVELCVTVLLAKLSDSDPVRIAQNCVQTIFENKCIIVSKQTKISQACAP